MKEEEELQLALAISKSEALEKEKQKLRTTSELLAGFGQNKKHEQENEVGNTNLREEDVPELSRYITILVK